MKWLLLFLCFSASAQPFNAVTGLPFLAPSAAASGPTTNLAQVAYRWVATDLTTNTAVVTWTDEIQGAVYQNGATANRPTNSNLGVWIDSSHWLTNAPLIMSSNVSFGFIFDVIDPTGGGGTHPEFLSSRNEGVCLNNPQLGFNSNNQYPLQVNPACTVGGTIITNKMDGLTNLFIDMIVSQTVTNISSGWTVNCWTNSVVSRGFSGSVGNGQYFGNPSGPIQLLGRNEFRGSGPFFRLKEFWIWTNSVISDTLLDQTLVNAFHNYGTNTYHY